MKCYSHNMVVCAVYVWSCILEHHCTETWEDRKQFHMEPFKPVILREAMEVRTDDVECLIHYMISHSRLEIRDLLNCNRRGFHHIVYMLQLYDTGWWKVPQNVFDISFPPTTHAEHWLSKYSIHSCESPGLFFPWYQSSLPLHLPSAVLGTHPHFPENCPPQVAQIHGQFGLCHWWRLSSVSVVPTEMVRALIRLRPVEVEQCEMKK